jgi:CRP/FNR family transcriptional regulator, cyclic AMP receptor protein
MVTIDAVRRKKNPLAGVPLFSRCSRRELRDARALMTEHHVVQGEILTLAGEAGSECFVIVTGTATVYREDTCLGAVGPGEIVGELALLDRGERTATVVADSDMTVLVMSRSEFATFQTRVPSVSRLILQRMAARLRKADEGWARSDAAKRALEEGGPPS